MQWYSRNINDTEQVGFSISSIFPKVNLIYPENDTYTNQENQTFSCNATDNLGLSNITLYIWNSTSLIYENITLISGTYNETSWNYTFNYEGNFFWNCLAYNNESNSSWSEKGNYTLVYDITPPTINLISPNNDYSTTSTSIIFYYNVSDASNIENCSLIINNAIDQTLTNITKDTTLNFTKSLSVGSYSWSISCVDSANNQGNSTTRSLTITSSGGGSSGSSSSITTGIYAPTEIQLQQGYTQVLSKDDKISITIKNSKHTINIKKIETNYANITIESNPINFILYLGEEKKIDFENDSYYDLYVKLNNLINNKANLTIKSINEYYEKQNITQNQSINQTNQIQDNQTLEIQENKPNLEAKKENFIFEYIIVVFFIVFIIFIAIKRFKDRESYYRR